jgi:hypothetical protein
MGTMIEEGTIQPFTALGHETAQMYVKSANGDIKLYNEVTNCPFCGAAIRLV